MKSCSETHESRMNLSQGSTNCVHGDERARNARAKRLSRARNYAHVNQSEDL